MATDVERLAVLVEANTKSYDNAVRKLQATTDRALNTVEARYRQSGKNINKVMDEVGSAFGQGARLLGTLGLGLGAARSIQEIGAAAEQYTKLQNALKVTGLEGMALDRTMGSLFEIAQRNGTALEPLTTLYGRVAQVQTELKASSSELLTFTDGVSQALRVAGTDSTAAAGALMQLSQALGSGTVRAEEFNSVNEGARPILQAVAAGLVEAGGSVAKLKELVTDGKVSSEAFFRAFLAGMPQVEQQAQKAQGTVAQATARMSNAFVMFIGKLDETTGASKNAAENISSVASAIDRLPNVIGAASSGFDAFKQRLIEFGNLPVWGFLRDMMGGSLPGQITVAPRGTSTGPAGEFANSAEGRAAYIPPVKPVSLADFAAPKKKEEAAGAATRDTFERALDRARKRIEVLKAETATIGEQAAVRDRARMVAELETAAKAANSAAGLKNTEVTAAQRDQINATADAMATASQRNDDLTRSLKAQQDVMHLAGETTIDVINALAGTAEDRANALKNVVNSLIQSLMRATLLGEGPLAGILGTASRTGGTGGIFGLLASAFVGGRAAGGPIPAGKFAIVGENGPEFAFGGTSGMTIAPPRAGGMGSAARDMNMNLTVRIEGAVGDKDLLARAQAGAFQAAALAVKQFSDQGFVPRLNQYQLRGV